MIKKEQKEKRRVNSRKKRGTKKGPARNEWSRVVGCTKRAGSLWSECSTNNFYLVLCFLFSLPPLSLISGF